MDARRYPPYHREPTGRRLAPLLVLFVLAAAVTACGSYGSTATPAPQPASATKAPAAGATAAAVSAGSLAEGGKVIFASKCSGCHGANGQGVSAPANIGPANQLAKYATAKGIYDKVSTTMPRNAPGSLSAAEYLQVVAFLLVQNNFVKATDGLDLATMASIAIK